MMEVAEPNNGSVYKSVRVTASHEPHSRLVAHLVPYTRFKILALSKLKSGETRACIVLDAPEARPFGWITAKTAFGTPFVQLYARPMYEVTAREALKVRCSVEPTSRFVSLAVLLLAPRRRAPQETSPHREWSWTQ